MASAETFIARRLLVTRRRVRFINVIGLISVAGIMLGVAALLLAVGGVVWYVLSRHRRWRLGAWGTIAVACGVIVE